MFVRSLRVALILAMGLFVSSCEAASSSPGVQVAVPQEDPGLVRLQPGKPGFVDLKPMLEVAPDNPISVSIEGPVKMRVWPSQYQSSGQVQTWYKRELLNYLVAVPPPAPGAASGTWTLKYRTGPGDTGEQATVTVRFQVGEPLAALRYTIGKRTPAGYGGFPLSTLPGGPAAKSIVAQSKLGAFAINSDNQHLAWAGVYGTPARLVVSPLAGKAAYWVDVRDKTLGRSWRIFFDVSESELNAAPNPAADKIGDNQLAALLRGKLYFGDQIILEDGQFTRLGTVRAQTPTVDPITRLEAPAAPYTTGWSPHGDVRPSPGWITIRSRNPLGAAIGPEPAIGEGALPGSDGLLEAEGLDGGAFYWRFSNIRSGWLYPNRRGAEKAFSWVMLDHSTPDRIIINAGAGESRAIFVLDNHLVGRGVRDSGVLTLIASDSQIVGNWIEGSLVDCINPAIINSEIGSGKSVIAWNFLFNKKNVLGAHPDYFQQHLHAVKPYGALAPGAVVELADFIGNMMVRGDGYAIQASDVGAPWPGGPVTPDDVGKAAEDGHGMFLKSTSRKDVLHRMKIAANVHITLSFHGIEPPILADGSVVSHNLEVYDYGVTAGALSKTGYAAAGPWSPGKGSGPPVMNIIPLGAGPGVLVSHNLLAAAGFPHGGPTMVDNLSPGLSITSLRQAQSYWVNPTLGDGAQSVRAVVDAWQPKPGSPALKSALPAGPFGDLSMIDFRRRTFDPEKLFR